MFTVGIIRSFGFRWFGEVRVLGMKVEMDGSLASEDVGHRCGSRLHG